MKKVQLLILLLPAYASMAQMGMGIPPRWQHDSTSTMSFYKNIGISVQKFDNLDARIKNYSQYKSLPEVIGTLGIGSIMQKGHFVAINGLTVGYAMNGGRKNKNSTLGFLGINADAGYNFFNKDSRAQIYPAIGLGLEGYRARFNKNVNDVGFNDVLGSNTAQNDIRPVTFTTLFFNYRAGLNLALQSKDRTGAIGLQAGYTGSFNDNSWRVNSSQRLDNAPSDKLSRFYANLFFTKTIDWSHHCMM